MKLRRSALWIVVTSAKLTAMTGWIIAPVIHVMRADLNIDPASAGLIITMHALTAALFYPVFEPVAEKGIKKLFVFGLLLYGIAGGSGLVITSYWLLLVGRAVLGIGLAAILNAVDTVLDLYEKEETYEMMKAGGSLRAFGSINWPIIGGILGIFSWHFPFAVYVLTIPLGIFAITCVPDIKKEKREPRIGPEKDSSNINPVLGYSLSFLTAAFLYTILVFLPQLLDEMGISFPLFISLFFIVLMISSAAASAQYQKISRFPCTTLILTALALWAGGFAIISYTDSGFIIAASVVLFGIGEGVLTSVVTTWMEKIPAHTTKKARTLNYLGQFMAPIIFGPAVVLGLAHVFLVVGVICAVMVVVFLLYQTIYNNQNHMQ